jgi:CRP-like cAMP-binding protein
MKNNGFLRQLSEAESVHLRPHLSPVHLRRDERLVEAGQILDFVYFPIDCVLSAVTVMLDGQMVETRTIGRETGFGLLQAIGHPVSSERVFAQIEGGAWRAPLRAFQDVVRLEPDLVGKVVQHAQATLIQATQDVACNALHSAQQRLCKWLLLTQDRVGGDIAPLTQEHLAAMLGLQRTTVTAVAGQLAADGLISTRRGKITIKDREGLIARACECYGAIELAVEDMLGASFKLDRLAAERTMVERHIGEGEARVARQRQVVLRLDGAGADPGGAKELLSQFEQILAESRRHLARLTPEADPD